MLACGNQAFGASTRSEQETMTERGRLYIRINELAPWVLSLLCALLTQIFGFTAKI